MAERDEQQVQLDFVQTLGLLGKSTCSLPSRRRRCRCQPVSPGRRKAVVKKARGRYRG